MKTNRGLAEITVQINQQLVRFNRVLTEEINKKVLKTLSVHKPLFSER